MAPRGVSAEPASERGRPPVAEEDDQRRRETGSLAAAVSSVTPFTSLGQFETGGYLY